jgi:Skp family chaperone for outer membrane proteins
MKIRAKVLGCLIGVVILAVCYEHSAAKSQAEKPALKIGVVSVRKIFQGCKKSDRYRQETIAERNKMMAELEKLKKEIDAEEARLNVLKPASSDYIEQAKDVYVKRANLQAQQEFYKQQMLLREQRWTADIYQDILRITGEIAEQKDLDLVFETEEPDIASSSYNELTTVISTHKVLYCRDCLDLSDEVITRLDGAEAEKPKIRN